MLNDSDLIREAALAGLGIAQLMADEVAADVAAGRLVRVLESWSWTAAGYYLYYTSRRQVPPPLAALIEALHPRHAAMRP